MEKLFKLMHTYAAFLVAVIILIILFIYSYSRHISFERDMNGKNTTMVIGLVTSLEGTRGVTIVHVKYQYKGEIIYSSFGTYQIDSLGRGVKVRLSISNAYPEEDKYIGVYANSY